MSDPDKKKNQEPEYDSSDASVSFTDVVSINVRNDHVHLGIGLRDVNDPGKIKINHKVYMTLDHFMRFSKLSSQVANNIEQQIKEQQDAAKKEKN